MKPISSYRRGSISSITRATVDEVRPLPSCPHMGWQPDGSYSLGSRVIRPNGEIQDGYMTRAVYSILPDMKQKGTIDGWKKAVSVLNGSSDEFLPHRAALLAGFGTPLLGLVEKQGCVISLAGNSGSGKTMSSHAAMSIFGRPNDLTQSASFNIPYKEIEMRLSALHSVPYLLDETTAISSSQMGNLVYLMANGQGNLSYNAGKKKRMAGSWNMIPIVTTNKPLIDMVGRGNFTGAQVRRFIELIMNKEMDYKAASVLAGIHQNYGVAGPVYIRHLVMDPDKVRSMFDANEKKIRTRWMVLNSDRFLIWSCAAIWTGGEIANSLGLTDIDVRPVIKFILGRTEEVSAIASKQDSTKKVTAELVNYLLREKRRVVFWNEGTEYIGPTFSMSSPAARVTGDGYIIIKTSDFKEAMRSASIPETLSREWMVNHVDLERKTFTEALFPSTRPVNCIAVNLEPLEEHYGGPFLDPPDVY